MDVTHMIVSGLSLGTTMAMAMLFNLSITYSLMTQITCLLILLVSGITTGVSFLPSTPPYSNFF